MRGPIFISILTMALMLIFSCKKENTIPSVETIEADEIYFTNAIVQGNVTDDGGETVTVRGICWSIHPGTTIQDDTVNGGFGTGIFKVEIKGLNYYSNYYYRAFATNKAGTSYGNEFKMTTLPYLISIEGIPQDRFTTLFEDNFDNNNNNWWIGNDAYLSTNISDGSYNISSLQSETFGYSYLYLSNFDPYENFEIEVKYKLNINTTNQNQAAIFYWGISDTYLVGFFLFENRSIYLFSHTNGSWNEIFYNENPNLVKPVGEYNILIIRKFNSNYYFFINGIHFYTRPFKSIEPTIGFGAQNMAIATFDYIKVRQIGTPLKSGIRNTSGHGYCLQNPYSVKY